MKQTGYEPSVTRATRLLAPRLTFVGLYKRAEDSVAQGCAEAESKSQTVPPGAASTARERLRFYERNKNAFMKGRLSGGSPNRTSAPIGVPGSIKNALVSPRAAFTSPAERLTASDGVCERLSIQRHVSLSLQHLESKRMVGNDLKATTNRTQALKANVFYTC